MIYALIPVVVEMPAKRPFTVLLSELKIYLTKSAFHSKEMN